MAKRMTILGAVVFVAIFVPCLAQADVMLTGAFSKAGSIVPVNGATGALVALDIATGIDFNNSGTAATPGVAGTMLVTSSTDDFVGLTPIGTVGLAKDFTFSGAGSANYPNIPLASFETVGPVTFDLLTVAIVNQGDAGGNDFLTLSGTGTFFAPGFLPTPGTFLFTANQAGTTFSFSASQVVQPEVIPEPATLSLLGLGLVVAGFTVRRRK